MRVPFLSACLSRGLGRGVVFLCLALAGCSKQGEGERCDQNNGNLDCETDLICKGETQLSLQGNTRGVGLCCPPVSNESTVEACRATAMLPPEPDAGAIDEVPLPVPTPEPDAGAQPDAAAPAP
jgi:hypothetical protein